LIRDLGLYSSTTPEGKYVHWDKLRRYPAPEGVTHEQWWAAIKLARLAMLKPFSLQDKVGGFFVVGSPDPLQRQVSEIDRDLSGRLNFPEELTNDATRDRYRVSASIEEAIHSSQLEGAATTSAVAREMLRSERDPRDRGERMIVNNFAAMQFVREVKNEPLTPGLVCEIHRIVTQGTLDDEAGAGSLRTRDDILVMDGTKVLHTPPEAAALGERVESMCRFANELQPTHYLHPVVRAALLHFWLGYDHPFVDGNGRTARALSYWSLLNSGYWLAEYISISHTFKKAPAKYARAYLYSETDGNDATYFVLYQLDVIQRGILALHAHVKRKARSLERTRRVIHNSHEFNHRQLAVLGRALSDPYATYTVRSHLTSHRITPQTARTDLNGLVKHGYLESFPAGRGKRYQPAPDLERRLKKLKA